MKPKHRAAQYLFNRYFRWRLSRLVAPAFPILLDFPVTPEPRYGYGKPIHRKLDDIISRGSEKYRARLEGFLALAPLLDEIARNDDPAPHEPSFLKYLRQWPRCDRPDGTAGRVQTCDPA